MAGATVPAEDGGRLPDEIGAGARLGAATSTRVSLDGGGGTGALSLANVDSSKGCGDELEGMAPTELGGIGRLDDGSPGALGRS